MIRGSYHNGFAPRDMPPLYPQLWNGCVGAWCPSLGVTGNTLYDWSGLGQHATLTNMDAATDWVASDGRYALDFDGTNDVASATPTAAAVTGSKLSWGCWINPLLLRNYCMPFGVANGGSRQFCFFLTNSSSQFFVDLFGSTVNLTGKTIRTGTWQHVFLVKDGASAYVYVDGYRAFSGVAGTITSVAGATVRIGSTTDWPYPGMVDDARIYNRALSENEVRTLAMARGIAYTPRIRGVIAAPGASIMQMRARSVSARDGMRPIGDGCLNCRTSIAQRQSVRKVRVSK